jgi:hypothetical protein
MHPGLLREKAVTFWLPLYPMLRARQLMQVARLNEIERCAQFDLGRCHAAAFLGEDDIASAARRAVSWMLRS